MRSLSGVSDKDSDRHLKFEEVLRYADFPSLDLPPWDTPVETIHKEIFDALNWLRKKKKVRKIMALKVLDRMYCPHDEKGIAIRTRRFEVEKLDWRYLDMAISYLTDPELDESPERLTELHLYSSGKRAAVDHWMGPNGVRVLRKVCVSDYGASKASSNKLAIQLKKLYVHLILVSFLPFPRRKMTVALIPTAGQDLIPGIRIRDLRAIIKTGIDEVNAERPREAHIEFHPIEQRWNSTARKNTENLIEM